MLVIGVLSGTSYDAVDAAAVELSLAGDTVRLRPLGLLSEPYADGLRGRLEAALPPAATTMAEVCALDTGIGQAFADLAVRANDQLCGGAADLVVSHGQTVFHWVEDGAVHGTLQLGQPAWIAERTGCAVVADLRARDVAAGGQGAPLVSAFDVMWLADPARRRAALNLGGIANLTVVGPDIAPVAFDVGPANALVDAAVRHLSGGRESYDADGRRAAAGSVHAGLLDRLLAEPYYRRPAPKTTGKELFDLAYVLDRLAGLGPVAPDDLVATLTALTARTVADAVCSVGAEEVVAAGGGTANPTLLAQLRRACDPVPVRLSDELGVPARAKEAYAFALLGFLSVHGLPGTVASCTGARHAAVLGTLSPGRRGFRLGEPPDRPPTRLEVLS